MKVKEIMVQPVIVTSENTTLEEAAQMLLQHCIGCLPVVDAEGKLVGIITESDFTGRDCGFPFSVYRAPKLFGEWVPEEGIERIYQAARTRTVKSIMTPCVVTATEEESVALSSKEWCIANFVASRWSGRESPWVSLRGTTCSS